jgi:hypothetical protein
MCNHVYYVYYMCNITCLDASAGLCPFRTTSSSAYSKHTTLQQHLQEPRSSAIMFCKLQRVSTLSVKPRCTLCVSARSYHSLAACRENAVSQQLLQYCASLRVKRYYCTLQRDCTHSSASLWYYSHCYAAVKLICACCCYCAVRCSW